jgi:hypothetical protein
MVPNKEREGPSHDVPLRKSIPAWDPLQTLHRIRPDCFCAVFVCGLEGEYAWFPFPFILHLPSASCPQYPCSDSYGSPGDADGVERTLPVDVRARKDNTELNGWIMCSLEKQEVDIRFLRVMLRANRPGSNLPWYLQGMPTVSQIAPRTCCPPPPMPATWNALALSSASKLYHR